MSLNELERTCHHQTMDLQREERRFMARLQQLGVLRSHCNQLYQKRDKIEKLSTLHDRLLQQEFILRKFRRIRSEVDSQRLRNEKLARELGQVKQELEDKESKLHATKVNMQKQMVNTEKVADTRLKTSELVNGNNNNEKAQPESLKVILKPVVPPVIKSQPPTQPPAIESNGFFNGNGNGNGNENSASSTGDDDEMATSFITGWTPPKQTGMETCTSKFHRPRYSASDAELPSNGFGENGLVSGSDGETTRPASDFISHTLPTYRYVPRTQMFLRRIGVDGGRKKTVESLYKDFHPRALQQPVSILSDEAAAEQSNNVGVSTSAQSTFATSSSAVSNNEGGEFVPENKQASRSILVVNKTTLKRTLDRRVRFDPLALLLDAALDGDIDLVEAMLKEVEDPSAPNDEGITALHNAICAGHSEMVQLLVSYGVDVNSADCDGWTGLHCAASCNNKALCQLLVENGAALFALTTPDRETPRDKCEPDEECFPECYAYLLEAEEKLGRINDGLCYSAFEFKPNKETEPTFDSDMLQFSIGTALRILRRGDGVETNWWWARLENVDASNGDAIQEGYVPNSYLALHPRNQAFLERYGQNR